MKKRIKPLITILLVVAMLLPNFSMMIVPNVANLKASAAEGTPYPVELAFNNIFVFEKWATNDLSSTVINGAGVPKQGGTLAADITNGSFRMTKTDMTTNEIFTAFSMGTESASQNVNYYMMTVKPGTSYNFSYNFTGTAQSFTPFVFMYTNEGLFAGIDVMVSYSSPAQGDNSFTFTTPANVTSIQIRFTIGDNNTNSSATSVYADVKNIVIQETVVPTESPNIFRFDDWAANSKSAAAQILNGTLATDTDTNSFTITKTNAGDEAYTGFSMDANPANNTGYYTMKVDASTDYSFVYDISSITASNFIAFVFFFDSNNSYISLVNYSYRGTSFHRLDFTTPSNAAYIQVRFGIKDSATSVSASVKDIVICKTEEFENIFDFDTWSTKSGSGGGISGVYGGATSSINAGSQSITLTSKGGSAGLTNFSTEPTVPVASSGTSFDENTYYVETDPGKSYLVSYDLSVSNGVAPGELSLLVAWYTSDKSWVGLSGGYTQLVSTVAGGNHFTFTVPANAEYFQVVYGLYNTTAGASATISNIEFYEYQKPDLTAYVTDPEAPPEYYSNRIAYTYTPGGSATYGTLPTPPAASIPSKYVFAGWYTGENGTGTRITADTPVSYESYTVYPKYEPAIDSLTVVTPPTKTTYTVGENLNTAGLVLQATINGTDGAPNTTFNITSGVYCTPEVLNTAGTQVITANYGGKTVTFNVTVNAYNETNITVNGASHPVKVANNVYTLDYSTTPFNRYELTYYSDSYVRGVITMDADTEEFFLEPSDNGRFASYIDSFLRGVNHYSVITIEFDCLDKEYGNFELYSVTTIAAPVPSDPLQFYQNDEYKVGINLDFGGVVSYIEDLDDDVSARVYSENGNYITKVDYTSKLSSSGVLAESNSVNLINTNDRGRYLQQSYYGTNKPPYVLGDYNGVPWNYNPVQGGNLNIFNTTTGEVIKGGEASKVIDYRITDTEIYVKSRPLDWGKNSVDYPDSYVTDSYMEAWYVFEDGMIKTYCRFVDYSGYPSNYTTQEFPALYTIEPLNNYVYYAGGTAWDRSEGTTQVRHNVDEPDFWGVLPSYNQYNPNGEIDVDVECNENWAAFTASPDADSFGIGVYSAGITDFHYGVFPAKYEENQYKAAGEQDATVDGGYVAALKAGTQNSYTHVTNYRHAVTVDPAVESPTSYIAPIGEMTFESYKPVSYSFYVTTGTEEQIREDFEFAVQKDEAAASAETKIAVPETVYMTPVDGASTKGQYYVNNKLDLDNNYDIVTVAEANDKMYVGIHVDKAESFTVNVTNTTSTGGEIYFGSADGTENLDGQTLYFDSKGTYIVDETYGLHFSGTGLQPGEKTTAKWEITATLEDGSVVTYTVFTVLYAPGRTVGAVSESRQNGDSNSEISSWITGANGVDHSQRSPLGSFHGDVHDSGYFKNDPLYSDPQATGGSSETSNDYIETTDPSAIRDGGANTSDDYSENAFVLSTAPDDSDSTRAQSYLGLLAIDKSRYSNTDQIPNLRIGFDVLRVGSAKSNSVGKYTTYYTLGNSSAFTSTDLSAAPSGWTVHSGTYTDFADNHTIPYRETVVPAYTVDDSLDGMYIHALNNATSDSIWTSKRYATAGTSVLINITDKSALRDAVTNGYSQPEDDPDFIEKLENAATVLGDPSSTQEQIDEATKDLNNAIEGLVETFYALKYDNLFSAYEFSQNPESMKVVSDRGTVTYKDGTLTVVNDTITGGEAYTNYGAYDGNYLIDLKPNTEYVFEYTATTDVAAQAFIFFYNANGGSGDIASNITVQTDGGAWVSKTESNPWIGNYQDGAGTHTYTIRFTTGANTTKAAFRFGNTSNDPVTSTFSNIKLIDAAHYYDEVEYTKTEDVYLEHASYGTLPTLTRTGYTFSGWADAAGNTVTGASIATEHKTIYSVWTEHRYTIVYNANGGSGSIAGATVDYTDTVKLAEDGFKMSGKKLAGWSTDPNASSVEYALGESVSKLTDTKGGTVTLYAVWTAGQINVTFDNLVDMKAWQESNAFKANTNITNATNTGFSVSNTANGNEKTVESTEFPVEAGKQYMIDIDITGDTWDVYIFFRNATTGGTGIDFSDGGNRYSYGGGGNASQIFTAPAGATKAIIRVDANQKSTDHTVNFENIRVYEYDGISPIEVTPSNAYYNIDAQYGTLPTPTKAGYTFTGWVDEDGKAVTSTSTVPNNDADGVVHLTSTWKINDTALNSDQTVIDFSTPVAVDAIGNDTIFTKAANANGATASITGVSTDGITFAATADGAYGTFKVENGKVVYTPASAVNGVETVWYQAALSAGDTTAVKSQITVAPASNVLYEESLFVTNTTSTGKDWSAPANTSATNAYQGVLAEKETEVYGYDASYTNSNYSNGTALEVTVDATNKRSKILAFTFTGTGFDLNSVCGPTTGVQVVSLKNNDTGKMVKSYIVDTYYGDATYGTLYQVPVISETGLDPANYTVQVVASYLPSMSGALNTQAVNTVNGMTVNTADAANAELREALAEIGLDYVLDAEDVDIVWFDDNSVLNGGMGAETPSTEALETASTVTSLLNVVDSIRVYNPIEDGDSYYIATETNAQYYNVMDNLVNGKEDGIIPGIGNFFAYVSGSAEAEITIENYESVGPKDELYLSKLSAADKAVAFRIKDFDKDAMRVMISLRAAHGTPKAKIGEYEIAVSSNTEMYYDITGYVVDGTITIQNTAENSLLSVVNIKITSESLEPAALSTDFDLMTVRTMMMAPAKSVEPNTPIVPENPTEPDIPEEPTEPDVPEEPEEPEVPEEPAKPWYVRIFEWLIGVFNQLVATIKTVIGF